MQYVEAPKEYNGSERAIFLAGTITGAVDWQTVLVQLLKDEDIVIFNPRRKSYNSSDTWYEEEQIKWEHKYLKRANAISFWFSRETLSPITLYELGAWSATDKTLFVGIDPGYSRIRDVEIQTGVARPDVKVCYNLADLAKSIKEWNENDDS